MQIKDRIARIQERMVKAALKVNRDPAGIKLVAVIKDVPDELVLAAVAAGIKDIAESRIQEARGRCEKIRLTSPEISYHFIGHLQRNKVGQALDMFDIIQSVDSPRLAEEINKRAVRPIPVLIEVNTSGETSKFGIEPDKAVDLVRFVSAFGRITVKGLMTIGPLADDPERSRAAFRKLKALYEDIEAANIPGADLEFLSMGMTDDFETAVEEGSNLVRIGRGLFA